MSTENRNEHAADANKLFSELTQVFEQFKLPAVNTSLFIDSRRKDVESMVAANKITYEALQTLAKTQTELLTLAMQGLQSSAKGVSSNGSLSAGANKLTEVAPKAWQQMMADMTQLAEKMHKAQLDVLSGLSERAKESLSEMQAQGLAPMSASVPMHGK
ncbi:TIGR01841 family phasin [Paucibacter sp. Y2R2-4]|uniref:TIGR01841 family phasin n=1 Tax=Paucibacter sp. Y2R2-4 TaxID=2893553 RepID=UPI0021E405C9|nr:TIGR01841 family phasin [Paucibacter sp. Y2R2-4]MCV2350310.1 TIGR01841 family phasin [Paucibacter sp. Y2R2-4]